MDNKTSHLDVSRFYFLSSGLKGGTESCGRMRVVGYTTSSVKRSRRQNPATSLLLFTVMTFATERDQVTDGRTVLENPGEMSSLASVCALVCGGMLHVLFIVIKLSLNLMILS